jgi:predicted DsbA family dithiol-disulfide isomerase
VFHLPFWIVFTATLSNEWVKFILGWRAYCQRRWGGDGWTRSLRAKGKETGANFRNWKYWPNSLKAHQMIAYLADRGADTDTSRCNRALFEALYEQGQNLSNVDTLVSIAVEELGLPSDEAEDLRLHLEQDKGANTVKSEIHQGRKKYGISGVPFFVVGKQEGGGRPYGFSGAQPPEAFLEIFKELAE